MTIKKQFEELVALLEANKSKKVSTMLPEILELCSAKQQAKTFKLNDAGEVTHVFCYYHKQWEDVSECPYGIKKSSASGLNSMCKIGYNQWSKQQRDYKKAKEELLQQVADGDVLGGDVPVLLEELEEARTQIVPLEFSNYDN